MTKDQLIARLADVPGDTPIMVSNADLSKWWATDPDLTGAVLDLEPAHVMIVCYPAECPTP